MIRISDAKLVVRILKHFQENYHHHVPPLQNDKFPWGKEYQPLPDLEEKFGNFFVKENGTRLEQRSQIHGGLGGVCSDSDVIGGDLILLCIRPNRSSSDWACFATKHYELNYLHIFSDEPVDAPRVGNMYYAQKETIK